MKHLHISVGGIESSSGCIGPAGFSGAGPGSWYDSPRSSALPGSGCSTAPSSRYTFFKKYRCENQTFMNDCCLAVNTVYGKMWLFLGKGISSTLFIILAKLTWQK